MERCLRRTISYLLEERIWPPVHPSFAIAATEDFPHQLSPTIASLESIIEGFRIVLGVPKQRTPTPKKETRKYSYTRLFTLKTNLKICQNCGDYHESSTICGTCYEKVRNLTNAIKRQVMDYNPYIGERQNRPIFVRFEDDPKEVVKGMRVIEMDIPRPTWFKSILKKD